MSAFSVVQIISASGSNSCSEFVKGSIPIRQSSSYSGMCFLNQRFESPDQRSKSDHFFLSTGVISLTRSRSLVSDSGCFFSSGIFQGSLIVLMNKWSVLELELNMGRESVC